MKINPKKLDWSSNSFEIHLIKNILFQQVNIYPILSFFESKLVNFDDFPAHYLDAYAKVSTIDFMNYAVRKRRQIGDSSVYILLLD